MVARSEKRLLAHSLKEASEPNDVSITASSASRSSEREQRACLASKEAKEATTPSSAARCSCAVSPGSRGTTQIRSSAPFMRRKVKSSMTHQSRDDQLGPARMTSVWQPARKIGRHGSDASMLAWSMHTRSTQTLGQRPSSASNRSAHARSDAHLAPAGSLHAWLTKASHSPSSHGSPSGAAPAAGPGASPLGERSDSRSLSKRTARKLASASGSSSERVRRPSEHSEATTAASRSSGVEPIRLRAASATPRSRGCRSTAHTISTMPMAREGTKSLDEANAGSRYSARSGK
mmetsp:Transcript_25790/g.76511  ORF Transcript_25790/g.76511 Transcript_25790/m.76511 type:complete len:291 (-) Transcript_25790:711-1583(-)